MKRTNLLLSTLFAFCSIFAQNKNDIEKYTSQKPQYGFIENKGQIHDQNYKANPDVKYLLCLGNGMNVQLKKNSFSYDTYKTETKAKEKGTSFDKRQANDEPEKEVTYYFHRVDIELVGANENPQIIAEEPSADYLNYYNAATPESGATNVRNYKKITYKNIYTGIDMEFVAQIGKEKPIEYNFIVHPGADAKQIKMHYIGANETQLAKNKINVNVAHGKFTESIPLSWIKETNNKLSVAYKNIEKDTYIFNIPSYSITQTLIIDPTPNLNWGTYYGSSNDDDGEGIACDSNGNIYIIGDTRSTTAIATTGAHQTTFGGGAMLDAFIVKFNNYGVCQWGTYYGGSDYDKSNGITCDNNGNIYIIGITESTTAIATTSAHQTTFGGIGDAFVVKFSSSGVRQWGSYYGGSSDDIGYGIACDSNGNVFITGYTKSTAAIATSGAHQATYGGGTNYEGDAL